MDCVLERNVSVSKELAPAGATPTLDPLSRRLAAFATIGEALDYAARGKRGLNFHDARGTLTRAYTYSELREDGIAVARRFVALGIQPGDRIALVAETGTEFAAARVASAAEEPFGRVEWPGRETGPQRRESATTDGRS